MSDEETFNYFGSNVGHYKLTFNKDTNGNYYWVSSEYVDNI